MESRRIRLIIYAHMPNIYQQFLNVNLIPFKLFCVFKKGHEVQYRTKFWSVVLMEERILSVYVNTVLRKIFRPKGEEVIGGWRKLHNEELHVFYSPKILRWTKQGACGKFRLLQKAYMDLVGKSVGQSSLEKYSRRRKENVKMCLKEIRWAIVDCIIWLSIETSSWLF
jgi:hypothetical protein